MQYRKAHCNWMMQKEADIWARTDKYLADQRLSDFLLTGNMTDCSSQLVGRLPIDSQGRNWQRKGALTRPVFDVEPDKLCEVRESGELLGSITKKAADRYRPQGRNSGLASGSDKACEILGLGCISREKAAIRFGTTATVTFTISRLRRTGAVYSALCHP